MKQQIGVLLQMAALAGLPVVIYWQLVYGFRLLVMPSVTLLAIGVFLVGTKLRESK